MHYILSAFIAGASGGDYVQQPSATYAECAARKTIMVIHAGEKGKGTDARCYYIGPDRAGVLPVEVTSEWEGK